MDKINDNCNVKSFRVIEITPEQLRTIADRMDLTLNNASLPKEAIICQVSHDIIFYYDPKTPTIKDFSKISQSVVGREYMDV